MRTAPPDLLPLFRSAGQARLLARVFLRANAPAPIAELARELGLDDGGLTREADRLERAGLIRSERVGRSRILRPNPDSPYYSDLFGLLMTAFGPAAVVGPALAGISGVERAYLFGSWAARYTGAEGPPPDDVDVLIVGEADRGAVYRAASALSDVLRREVNPTIVSPERWEAQEDGFVRDVRSSPLVPLDLTPAG
jgi:DNA-binding transcriptional ArsR family regulator